MKSQRIEGAAASAAVAVCAAALWASACTGAQAEPEPRDEVVRVSVATCERRDLEAAFSVPVSVEAYERTVVRAQADGLLSEMRVDLGDVLEPGQVVAVLEAPELERELAVIEAETAEAAAAVAQARASKRMRTIARDKLRHVADRGPGLIARHEVDEAEAQVDLAEARIRVASARVQTLKARQDELRTRRALLEVIAPPYPSVVTARLLDRGAAVRAGVDDLMEVVRRDAVRGVIAVPADQAPFVAAGAAVTITAGEHQVRTELARVSGALDPDTRTLRAEARLDGVPFTPGSFGRARVTTRSRPAVVAPAGAVAKGPAGATAWLSRDGRLARASVTTGHEDGAVVEILSGLGEAEQIVTSGLSGFTEGARCLVTR